MSAIEYWVEEQVAEGAPWDTVPIEPGEEALAYFIRRHDESHLRIVKSEPGSKNTYLYDWKEAKRILSQLRGERIRKDGPGYFLEQKSDEGAPWIRTGMTGHIALSYFISHHEALYLRIVRADMISRAYIITDPREAEAELAQFDKDHVSYTVEERYNGSNEWVPVETMIGPLSYFLRYHRKSTLNCLRVVRRANHVTTYLDDRHAVSAERRAHRDRHRAKSNKVKPMEIEPTYTVEHRANKAAEWLDFGIADSEAALTYFLRYHDHSDLRIRKMEGEGSTPIYMTDPHNVRNERSKLRAKARTKAKVSSTTVTEVTAYRVGGTLYPTREEAVAVQRTLELQAVLGNEETGSRVIPHAQFIADNWDKLFQYFYSKRHELDAEDDED